MYDKPLNKAIVHTGMYSPFGKYSTHISKYRKNASMLWRNVSVM